MFRVVEKTASDMSTHVLLFFLEYANSSTLKMQVSIKSHHQHTSRSTTGRRALRHRLHQRRSEAKCDRGPSRMENKEFKATRTTREGRERESNCVVRFKWHRESEKEREGKENSTWKRLPVAAIDWRKFEWTTALSRIAREVEFVTRRLGHFSPRSHQVESITSERESESSV